MHRSALKMIYTSLLMLNILILYQSASGIVQFFCLDIRFGANLSHSGNCEEIVARILVGNVLYTPDRFGHVVVYTPGQCGMIHKCF